MTKDKDATITAITVTDVVDGIDFPVTSRARTERYPIGKLTKPGQSFMVVGGRPNSIQSALYDVARKLGVKVRCAKVTENGKVGIRCWRMPDDWKSANHGRKPKAP